MSKIVTKILELEPDKYIGLSDKELTYCGIALHENKFMQSISHTLTKPLFKALNNKEAHSVVGLLMGTALDDKILVRNSLLGIIVDRDINRKVLEGLIAVLIGDIEVVDSIKEFAKELDIDG